MNFQNLQTIEKPDFYLDVAFRRAADKAELHKKMKKESDKTKKQKQCEIIRIDTINDKLLDSFMKILRSYPSIRDLPEFYQELIKCTLDFAKLKKSLGAINWVVKKIKAFSKQYLGLIRKSEDMTKIMSLRKEYYGRISSLLKQIKEELSYLEECRRIMRQYPTVKTSVKSVSIIGFPNVGKTTLLYKLTGSKPEINSYPFTTKGINISYIKEDGKKLQLLDTPGTLDRENKMNDIERQAYLSIKYVAEQIVYVFDPTEEYYSLKDQIKLLNNIRKFDKKIIIFISKEDIAEEEKIKELKKRFKGSITNTDKLKTEIMKIV